MRRIALAGGIGAGKSTVVDHLRGRGFAAVDADEVYRDLTQAGQPVLAVLVDAFGSAILTPDGALDRPFLAAVVFDDPTALARLNAITHPAVAVEMRRRMDEASGAAVFAAIPLFGAQHRDSLALDEVWAIQVDPEVAIDRLVRQRGMSAQEARQRIAAQMGNEERAALVDEVIWNDRDRESLLGRIDELLRERGLDEH